jgi:hypothetical protein
MITGGIDLARLFLESYQSKNHHEAGKQRVRETLHRELRLNAELVSEAGKVATEKPQLSRELLKRLQTESFDAFSAAGLPLAEIFVSRWSVGDHPGLKYKHQFRSINHVSELVERAYHRIRVQQIRSEVDQSKNARSLGYPRVLLGTAAQATKSPV